MSLHLRRFRQLYMRELPALFAADPMIYSVQNLSDDMVRIIGQFCVWLVKISANQDRILGIRALLVILVRTKNVRRRSIADEVNIF